MYKSIVDNALAAIIITTTNGVIVEANKAACSLFGYTAAEMSQLKITELLTDSNVNSSITSVIYKDVIDAEVRGITKTGDELALEVKSNIFYDQTNAFRCTVITDISVRKLSEQEMWLLVNNTVEAYILLDTELCIVSFNKKFADVYKEQTGTDIKKGESIFTYALPESTDALKKLYKKVLKGSSEKSSVKFPAKDDQSQHFAISYAPAINQNKEIVGVFVTGRDITRELLNIGELRKTKDELLSIMEASVDVICAVNAQGIFEQVSAASKKVFGYDPKEMIGRTVFEFMYSEDHQTTRDVIQKMIDGDDSALNVNRYVKKDGSLVTIEWNSKLDKKTQKRYGVARDITQQQKSKDILLESEKRYKNLFENNPSPMIIWDFKTRQILDCNVEATLQYGYTKKEFQNLKVTDIRSPDEVPALLAAIETEESYGQIHRRVWIHKKKNGTLMDMNVTGHLLDYNNRRAALILMHDITTEVQAEAQREFERRENEALINTTEDLIWSVSHDRKLIAGNQPFFQIIKEKTGVDMKPGDDVIYDDRTNSPLANYWRENYKKALLGKKLRSEVHVPSTDGKTDAWFDISYNPIKKGEEVIGIACYSRNITNKKLADIKITESEARLAAAQSVAKVGSWEIDLEDGKVFWSAETYNIFGIVQNAAPFYQTDFFNLIAPEDRKAVEIAFKKSLDSQTLNWQEYKIVLPDGTIKFLEERWQIMRDNTDHPIKAIGTCQDITERKHSEEEIKKSEQTYKVLFEKSALPKWIYDLENFNILDVNFAAVSHYGYSREEFLHMNLSDLRPESEIPKLRRAQESNNIREGVIHFGIFTHLKKNGTQIQVEVSGTRINYQENDCMVVIINDVTQREVTLDILMDREAKLQHAQHIAKLGYWQFNISTQVLYWSNEVYKIWGLDEKERPGMPFLLSTIHPDDREIFLAEQHMALRGQKEMDIEHRIVLVDGTVKWVHEKGNMEKDEQGRIISLAGTVQDITPQKLMALSLEESNQRYKFVAKATSDTIWDWNLITNNIYWSDGIEKIFGYNKEEVDGPADVWKQNIHPEDVDRVLAGIEKIINDPQKIGVNCSDEYRFRKANGQYTYVSDRGFIIRDIAGTPIRMVGAMQDITQRKKEEQHLKLLESVIINTNDSVLIIEDNILNSNDHRVVYVNKAFEKMTGYAEQEVLGRIPSVLQGPKTDKLILQQLDDAMQKGEAINVTFVNYKKNGSEFWNNVSLSPVQDAKGFITNWIAVERDVTDKMLYELQLKELNTELQQNVRALAVSNAELEQFAYVASHDLQEPLRMITSFVTQLDKRYSHILDDKGKQYIAFAVDGSKRMRQIILDLLEYSKVGRSMDGEEEIDLNDLLHEIRVLYRRKIELKNAIITTDVLPVIRGHISPMRQVFQNLISNALKYSKEAAFVNIHISFKELEHHFQFAIQDDGIGINKDYYKQIFVIFQRLHNKDEYSGTGMGLSIAKKIVENMGGNIWVESEEGEGSTFYFTVAKHYFLNTQNA